MIAAAAVLSPPLTLTTSPPTRMATITERLERIRDHLLQKHARYIQKANRLRESSHSLLLNLQAVEDLNDANLRSQTITALKQWLSTFLITLDIEVDHHIDERERVIAWYNLEGFSD